MAGGAGYKYSGVANNGSLLFRTVLEPVYARLVECVPRWITPNQMTVSGITATACASALILRRIAADELPAPCELAAAGVLNLFYMVADNLDGKQARRTGTSSAIGEYLDHGGDCCTSLVTTWWLFRLFSGGQEGCLAALAFTTAMAHVFHLATGKHTLGGEFFSADEGMLLFGIFPLLGAAYPTLYHPLPEPLTLAGAAGRLSLPGALTLPGVPLWSVVIAFFCLTQALTAGQLLAAPGVARAAASPATLQLLLSTLLLWLGRDGSVGWGILTSAVASYAIHILIAAACVKKSAGHPSLRAGALKADLLVLSALPVAWLALPQYRAAVAVGGVCAHVAQMVSNARGIIAHKHGAAAAAREPSVAKH